VNVVKVFFEYSDKVGLYVFQYSVYCMVMSPCVIWWYKAYEPKNVIVMSCSGLKCWTSNCSYSMLSCVCIKQYPKKSEYIIT